MTMQPILTNCLEALRPNNRLAPLHPGDNCSRLLSRIINLDMGGSAYGDPFLFAIGVTHHHHIALGETLADANVVRWHLRVRMVNGFLVQRCFEGVHTLIGERLACHCFLLWS